MKNKKRAWRSLALFISLLAVGTGLALAKFQPEMLMGQIMNEGPFGKISQFMSLNVKKEESTDAVLGRLYKLVENDIQFILQQGSTDPSKNDPKWAYFVNSSDFFHGHILLEKNSEKGFSKCDLNRFAILYHTKEWNVVPDPAIGGMKNKSGTSSPMPSSEKKLKRIILHDRLGISAIDDRANEGETGSLGAFSPVDVQFFPTDDELIEKERTVDMRTKKRVGGKYPKLKTPCMQVMNIVWRTEPVAS